MKVQVFRLKLGDRISVFKYICREVASPLIIHPLICDKIVPLQFTVCLPEIVPDQLPTRENVSVPSKLPMAHVNSSEDLHGLRTQTFDDCGSNNDVGSDIKSTGESTEGDPVLRHCETSFSVDKSLTLTNIIFDQITASSLNVRWDLPVSKEFVVEIKMMLALDQGHVFLLDICRVYSHIQLGFA